MSNQLKQARFLVLTCIALMVLVVVPSFYDLTNIPKYSVLFIVGSLGLFLILNPKFGILKKQSLVSSIPPILFLIFMLLLAVLTDEKYIAFFGKYGRNNGWFQYAGFVILFLLTAFSFNINTISRLLNLLIILGFITSVYGFLQYLGIDFINYSNTQLPVIATFGNSNFASAFIGFSAIALFWKIMETKDFRIKSFVLIVLIFQIYVATISNSSQGIFISIFGILTFIGVVYFTKNLRNICIYFGTYLSLLTLTILGLLQKGPLEKLVYQPSTTYRGDYFRAAWEMFSSNIFTGVGIDRYGDYYREFRDVSSALRLGPSSVAYYAHNNFLQLLATGGIFLFFLYLTTIVIVLIASFKAFKKSDAKDKKIVAAIFTLWISFQAQSLVSINQVSLAVTGWVFAGALVAIGLNSELISANSLKLPPKINSKKTPIDLNSVLSIVLSLCIFISVLFWLVPLWRAESNIKLASKLRGDNANIAYVNQKKNLVLEAINLKPNDINYRIMAADYLTELGELELARQQLQRAIEIDPRSYESIIYLAQVYERAQLLDPAIKLRISATNKDKFDTRNWLQLGINLAAMGDYASVTRVIESVRSFDNKNPILKELDKLIPKQ